MTATTTRARDHETERSLARSQTAELLKRVPDVSCTGWRFHCICTKHRAQADGLAARYQAALQHDDAHTTELLRTEILHIQNTLARTRSR
jgi:hypothetical protein